MPAPPLKPHKELQHSIQIHKIVIDGYEMHPRRKPRIMPLAINRRFDGHTRTPQEGTEATREGVPVYVGQVFVAVLLGHGNAGADFEEWVCVGTEVVGLFAGEAPDVGECGIGERIYPWAEGAGRRVGEDGVER